jgi:3-deoxy-D-manno-octulosonic-acid transferase
VYFLYSFLMGLAALVTAPYWIMKGLRHGKYFSNLGQRLGFSSPALEKLPTPRPDAIWIHAVSVGEALAGATLAKRLKETHPQRPVIISTTTLTGQALAKARFPFADAIIYFPLDWAFCVKRVMDRVQPAIVIILETEIWPNFLRIANQRLVPVLFLSGRISDRSFARYQEFLGWFGFYLRPFLKSVLSNATAFQMQTDQDAERIKSLGAPPEKVLVSGNLKYDMELPTPTPFSAWLETECKRLDRWPVIVAGSVVATEEPLALIAYGVAQGDFPKSLLVLAPRKPERFAAAAAFIDESHRKFIRRSELAVPGPGISGESGAREIPADATVLLLDSIGELASLYKSADGVFVGGSLVSSGGHNILEPAAFGKVPVFGDSMENFAEIAALFIESGAAIQVGNPEDAGVELIHLLKDRDKMQRMGDTARRLVESSRGALDRSLTEIEKYLGGATR